MGGDWENVPHEGLQELADEMRKAIRRYYDNPPKEVLPRRDRPVCPYCIEQGQSPRRKVLFDELGRPLPACNLHIYIPSYKGLAEMPRMGS